MTLDIMQITEILKYIESNINSAFFYTPNIYTKGESYLFKKPSIIFKGKGKKEVEEILIQADELSQNSNYIGFATIPYEIGYYFQPKEINNSYLEETELCFYFYEKRNVEIISSNDIQFDKVENYLNSKAKTKDFKLDITKDEYVEKINKIKKYISDGDTYQINFTTKAKFSFNGKITSLFLNGIFNQSANYSVLINTDNTFLLSFSPELFFKTDYKTIYSKPMKGTLKRKGNPFEDKKLAASLLKDEKNLAENVMIVDLMRNDIGRIANIDSVKVDKLYEVEKYETLYQLTSTVIGELKEKKLSQIFKNLFPSGSITGAPKIRSMQIIAELEKSPRNLYTGSIGLITNENAIFNIPIRTISIDKKTMQGELGLGSGIVWDSDPENEFEEVLLKGRFITNPLTYFELLETLLFENGNYFLLDYHLNRLKSSVDYFLFKYEEAKIDNALKNISTKFEPNKKYKVRLLLSKWGNTKVELQEITNHKKNAKIILSKIERCDIEKFLYHKTTYRPWDEELKKANPKGFDEVLFINENDQLLEGAISNIVIENNNKRFTPPLELGILNGCYRQYLLDKDLCKEKLLTIKDLHTADKVILCNSVRKEISVNEIFDQIGTKLFTA
jgi:para-aminobenzoate synthetase/4-amino-4-deoxychorismate lyase